LSESEALQIAQDAATAAGHNGQLLQWTHLHVLDGKLSWSVSAPGIGNVLQAFVDDETGEVVSIGRRPGR
jgi:hypothetical protein